MKARALSTLLVLLLATPGTGVAQLLTLPGPQLDNGITGWSRLGLQLTVHKDVVLRQFVFSNQGLPDVLRLEDAAGAVLGEYPYPGGEPLHEARVDWPLAAGAIYYLVSENNNNGRWTSYYDFPLANDHIQVDAAVGNGGMFTSWWFNFNALQTEVVVPPPQAPTTLTVSVDVKPGSPQNVVNLKSRGKIPVAILSDALFDATTVDPASIQMAGAGVVVKKHNRLMANRVDVNADGLVDLLVLFNIFDLVPELLQDGAASLTAVTADGVEVGGSDNVVILQKTKKASPRGRK